MMFLFTAMETERRQTSLNYTFISSCLYLAVTVHPFFSLCASPPQLSLQLPACLRLFLSQPLEEVQTRHIVLTLHLSPLLCISALPTQLQTSERMLSDISETLDQTKTSLDAERQQRQQIQDQLHHANKKMEHLQQEITHVRHTAEKKVIGFLLKVSVQILLYTFLQKLCLSNFAILL